MTSHWAQNPIYNYYCPYDTVLWARSVVGCVATAMAQIMRYWQWPEVGYSSHSYLYLCRQIIIFNPFTAFFNFGESKRNKYYKLTDPFCLFYLTFALKHPTNNKTYWQDNQNLPKLSPWRGQAFENVCEMKFVQGTFSINKDYDEKLRNKIVAITEKTNRRKNPQMTLVTTYGLKNGIYSGRFQKVVIMDDLFTF